MNFWEQNARIASEWFGAQVNLDERFYICPECGEPIYENDYDEEDVELMNVLCPVCGFTEN